MLHDLLLTSAIAAGLGTVLLLLGGKLPLGGPVWRILLGLLIGGVAYQLGGRSEAATAVVLVDLVLALLVPPAWWAIGSIAFANLTVATVIYVAYLVDITIILTNSLPSLILGTILLLLQVGALGLMVASVFEMVDALCRPVTLPALPPPPAIWPIVCFQVPAHEEPPDILIKTIRSLAELDYPRERLIVQVIDNNTTDESLWKPVETECTRLASEGHRVQFTHLEKLSGYKAGALNWGRHHLPGGVEILGIVDSDYVVGPGLLRETIPYFNDPQVAFVQSPQEYREWEGSAFYRACHTGFAYFFVVGMISRSYRNAIIFAGTMGLIRRSSLDEIGGWDEAIITEDAEASLRMLARGGRGIYVPRAFGRGIMPLTYEAMRGQRFRWAFGGIQILRKHWRSLLPWSQSGLSQRQRRDYLLGGLWWFNDAMTLGFTLYVAATALGFLAHRPFVVQRLYGLGIVLPLLYLALGLIRYLWGLRAATGVSLREALDAMRVNLSLSWVVTLACVKGLIEKRGVFLRTPKVRGGFQALEQLRVVWAETLFSVASMSLAIWVFFAAGFSVLTLSLDSLLLWAALVYGSATSFALGDPERPPESLRRKALLEVAPAVGTVMRSSVRIGLVTGLGAAVILIAVAVAGESGRTPVQGGPVGPLPQIAQVTGAPGSGAPGGASPGAPAGPSGAPSTATPANSAPPTAPPATPAATPKLTAPPPSAAIPSVAPP